ncbi:MAG: rhodanese-related sulfurtransferase [Phycisphaerales bacterium]|nr:rhodanese-related sulfurtransferase [Phycisphaerales bacterium]MCH2153897.1 rhodanese-related sulfurtransferase [Phycisphaerales bacterium]
MDPILVATFYQFTPLEDYAALQTPLEACCDAHDVRGIILLASEGINSTIAGPPSGVMAVLDMLREDPRLAALTWKESSAKKQPFRKIRVRLKKEIVTMGVPGIDPCTLVGTYVKPEDWNALISDPEVIVIDTRNDYEIEIGTFQRAINPEIQSFNQLPQWLEEHLDGASQPRVAMFCTGGIRCEKSTALLKQTGIKEVYHLEGGILKYLEQIPEAESLWQGKCFVFDERVSVGHGLQVGEYELCRACRRPIQESDKESPHYLRGVSCPQCHDQTTDEQKSRFAQRQKQIDLARSRGETHLAS